MQEIAIRYVNGPLQGVGSVAVPEGSAEPPLLQRIPLPSDDHGLRRTITDAYGGGSHAVYERSARNASGEWEFQLVRVE